MPVKSNDVLSLSTGCIIGSFVVMTIGGLGAFLSGLGEAFIDSDLQKEVTSIAKNVDSTLHTRNGKIATQDISTLRIPLGISSDETTIQMTGTFEGGYCIAAKNPGGNEAERGIFYSVSDTGVIKKDETDCIRSLTNESIVFGPDLNTDYTEEKDAKYTFTSMLMGSTVIGALSAGTTAAVKLSRRKQEDESSDSEIESSASSVGELNSTLASDQPEYDEATATDKVSSIMQRMETIKSEWSSYELDLVKILAYPDVTSMSVPATAEFHKALRTAQSHAPVGRQLSVQEISVFNESVTNLEHRFDVMIAEAKRNKWKGYSTQEQESLRTAQNLLSIAINAASSMNERQIAYRRLIKEVEGILVFPEKAVLELEARVSPAITISDLIGHEEEGLIKH